MLVKNNKGLTLIELLAGLAIVGVILSFLFGIIISGIHAYQKENERSKLRQDANLVISNISNYFYDHQGVSLHIGITKDHNVYLDKPSNIISDPSLDYSQSVFTSKSKTLIVKLSIIPKANTYHLKPYDVETTLIYRWKGE